MAEFLFGEEQPKRWHAPSNKEMQAIWDAHKGCLLSGPNNANWCDFYTGMEYSNYQIEREIYGIKISKHFLLLDANKRSFYWRLTIFNFAKMKVERFKLRDDRWYSFEILSRCE